MHKVLILDDEKNIVSSLTRLLRAEGGFTVAGFTSAAEALAQAKEEEFDVVVADYRMPEMDGTRFLEKFRAIQPHSYRIILTAFSDEGMLRKAINQAQIHSLVRKPWDGLLLLETISQGAEQNAVLKEVGKLRAQVKTQAATIEGLRELLQEVASKHPQALPADWQDRLPSR